MIFPLVVALVCFTAIVIYRMSMDRLRILQQHERNIQGDAISYQRYLEVQRAEPPKAKMPDLSGRTIVEIPSPPRRQITPGGNLADLERFYEQSIIEHQTGRKP